MQHTQKKHSKFVEVRDLVPKANTYSNGEGYVGYVSPKCRHRGKTNTTNTPCPWEDRSDVHGKIE